MMDAIYTAIMKLVYNRFHIPQRSTMIADAPLAKFQDRLTRARRFQVISSGNGIYQVQAPDSGRKYITNLREKLCDCRYFHDFQSPCTHAIAACLWETEDPYEYFEPTYKVSTYRKTYKHFMKPFNIENLDSDPNIQPPIFKKHRGRPRTKRIRKGALRRKATKCSNCQNTGHSKRTCRFAPAVSGRRQRMRDREVLESESSNYESALEGSDSELNESENSEDRRRRIEQEVEDWRFERDIQRLNRYRVEAKEALVERAAMDARDAQKGQKRKRGAESDVESELSMLVDSHFDGMERAEMICKEGVTRGDSGITKRGNSKGTKGSDNKVKGGDGEAQGGTSEVIRVTRSGRKYTTFSS
jgi:hypothetical protein